MGRRILTVDEELLDQQIRELCNLTQHSGKIDLMVGLENLISAIYLNLPEVIITTRWYGTDEEPIQYENKDGENVS